MAKSAEVSLMNVSAIRLVDRHVCDIIDTATHVALYQFNPQTYEWEKTHAEGALFVYSRNGEPRYSFIVLNRLNTQNQVETINESIDLQLQEPFLLYKNLKDEIHGIWFYNRDECVRIAVTIDKLVIELCKSNLSSVSPEKKHETMQHQADTPEGTSKRVMDFFARAGSKAPSLPPGSRIVPPPGMTNVSKPTMSPGIPNMSRDKQSSEVNPILQRLMSNSNPITVEQLEKQHRTSPPDNQKGRSKPVLKKENSGRPVSLPVPNSPKLENGLSLLHVSESPPQGYTPSSMPSQPFFNSPAAEPLEVSVLEQSVTMDTPTKPALIPPLMFTSNKEEHLTVKPEPLTKSQLLQAVSYLLKNDADFVNKLHEAYVKSFVDMVS